MAGTATGSSQIVTVDLHNAGSASLSSGIATFGQVFAMGDVPAGSGVVGSISGQAVAVQLDVKTRHADGSVKHAVVSVERPALGAGQEVQLDLSLGSAAAGPAVNLAAASQGHSFVVELTPQGSSSLGSSKVTVDVLAALRQALTDGTASVWQSGPLASQARVEVDLPGSMRLKFDVTAYKDGQISVDAMFANDEAMEASGGRVAYEVVGRLNGAEVIRESVSQGQYQTWHREVSSGGANGTTGLGDASSGWLNIKSDVEYLKSTGAVAQYDLSIAVDPSILNGYGTAIATSAWDDPLSANGVTQYMPTTGGRPDLGFTTQHNVVWLLTGDVRAAEYALGQASAAGSVPWHFWDDANNTWLNTQHYPKLWTDSRGGTGKPGDANSTGLTQQVPTDTGWAPDLAHQPDLSFVPYLLTGERWMLDNLNAQSSFSVMSFWPFPRENGEGLVIQNNQTRGGAWSMRQIENSAWINPDGSVEQAYFKEIAQNNWDWIQRKIPEWNALQGEAHGWVNPTHSATVNSTVGNMAPWQQDYLAGVAAIAAKRGSEGALEYLEWASNFLIGRFEADAKGFDTRDGAAYQIVVKNPLTGEFHDTWAEIGAATRAAGYSNENGWLTNSEYARLALATLAAIHDLTGSARAEAAYRALLLEGAPATDQITYGKNPAYAISIPHILDQLRPPGAFPTGGSSTSSSPVSHLLISPAPVITTAQSVTLGSGKDTLVLKMSQDFYLASAQYVVRINDVQVGGTQVAGAIRTSGERDTLTLKGDWGGTIKLSVQFLNDQAQAGVGDRNLWINGITLNGIDQKLDAAFYHQGSRDFTISKPVIALPEPQFAFIVDGSTGADTLVGSAGDDILNGKAGADVLTGGAGADTFRFARGDGADRITDFTPGSDRILFKGIDPATLKASLATIGGATGTQITYGSGDSVFLAGVTALKAGDLVFADVPAPPPPTAPAAVAAPTPTAGFTPVNLTLGTGKDTLVLKLNQDFWSGSAQYVLSVNGTQIGGTLSASALKKDGLTDTITLKGSFGDSASLGVRFINDAYGGAADRDRNLYVQDIVLNGTDLDGLGMSLKGASTPTLFQINKPATLSFGSGADTLVLKINQDFYLANAQYTVSINGTQIGGTLTASSIKAYGQADTLTIKGNWGSALNLSVKFLNDQALAGVGDRNLWISGATLNGADMKLSAAFYSNGGRDFTLTKPGIVLPAPTYASVLDGTAMSNVLNGSSGNDLIRGNGGNDTMTGRGGRDTFIFAAGDGQDTVTDFVSGTDRLLFSGIDPESVRALASTTGGVGGTLLTYGSGADSVFLQGVSKLAAGDLVFD
jgi:Ca2+-binding RTX toxin-like protein